MTNNSLKNIKLNSSLNKVRDIFLFACYTGLSYIDLYNLNIKNIQKGNDGLQWIYIKRHKTDIPSNVPILPYALYILNIYNIIIYNIKFRNNYNF